MGYIPDETGAAAQLILETRRLNAEALNARPYQPAPGQMSEADALIADFNARRAAVIAAFDREWREQISPRLQQIEAAKLAAEDAAWRVRAAAEVAQREAAHRAEVTRKVAQTKANAAAAGLSLDEYLASLR